MELNEFLRLNYKPRGARAQAKFAKLLAEEGPVNRGPISLDLQEGAFMYVAKQRRRQSGEMMVGSIEDAFSLDEDVISRQRTVKATDFMPPVTLGKSFGDLVVYWMNKKDLKAPDVYGACYLTKANFSKQLKPGHHPSKKTALALCIGLQLNLEEAEMLLEVAGYSFSKSIYMDVVYKYYIIEEKYSIDDIMAAICRWEKMQLEE